MKRSRIVKPNRAAKKGDGRRFGSAKCPGNDGGPHKIRSSPIYDADNNIIGYRIECELCPFSMEGEITK